MAAPMKVETLIHFTDSDREAVKEAAEVITGRLDAVGDDPEAYPDLDYERLTWLVGYLEGLAGRAPITGTLDDGLKVGQ